MNLSTSENESKWNHTEKRTLHYVSYYMREYKYNSPQFSPQISQGVYAGAGVLLFYSSRLQSAAVQLQADLLYRMGD